MTRAMTVVMVLMACGLAACTFRGTTDSVTDTTQNVTVSTSGRTWFTIDGVIRNDQRVNAFVAINFENLKQNMAQGHGEYLTSLSSLMQIREDRKADFYSLVQSRYPQLVAAQSTTPAEMIASLNRELTL
jgi:Protein of unknown function (DUF3015)